MYKQAKKYAKIETVIITFFPTNDHINETF